MRHQLRIPAALLASIALLVASCGSDAADEPAGTSADAPTVVVTTNILGDVVEQMVGDRVNVVTIMPVGADPHDFQASAQQVAQIGDAAVLIVNGAGFEEGLLDVIESAEADGTLVYEALSNVATIEFGEGAHDHGDHKDDEDHDEHDDDEHDDDEDHDDEDHDDEDHDDHDDDEHDEHDDDDDEEDHDDHDDDDHDEHGHSGVDPHFFTDPARMAVAADGIADFLVTNLDGVDTDALRESAAAYVAELKALDAEVADTLASLDANQRVIVTNHEVFGYFADRYDFEVVGSVIPSGSTADGASAQALAELAEIIRDEGVPAIFADTSSSNELAETLAGEVGEIEVVELFSESLGDADSNGATYVDMVRSNAEQIATALG